MLMSLSTLGTIQDLWLFVKGLILSMSVVTKFAKTLYILDAARKIGLNGMSNTDGFPVSLEHSTRIDDCKNIASGGCPVNLILLQQIMFLEDFQIAM
jgi:hypothetical protein